VFLYVFVWLWLCVCALFFSLFFFKGRLSPVTAHRLIKLATELFFEEPNVLDLSAPIVIVGDIHGQFHDMLNLIASAGEYVFFFSLCFFHIQLSLAGVVVASAAAVLLPHHRHQVCTLLH
jgi:hypothetical protein